MMVPEGGELYHPTPCLKVTMILLYEKHEFYNLKSAKLPQEHGELKSPVMDIYMNIEKNSPLKLKNV